MEKGKDHMFYRDLPITKAASEESITSHAISIVDA